jgi:hypothetical protein
MRRAWKRRQEQRDGGSLALEGCVEASLIEKNISVDLLSFAAMRWMRRTRHHCRMGGEAIERRGLAGESKETTVLPPREDERRPSWSFVSEKNERRGEERA